MPIRVLPSEVIDQIAAGEVVERPAHLLKELVENSLDAGATVLDIEFNQGGRQVRVRDNGSGIPAAELPLAVARHATSKIQTSADLWALNSYGFRGEALASIAAVSRLHMISRPEGQDAAQALRVEFGHVSASDASGGETGTTVLIEDLFANVPARLKFLKSEAAEHTQIKTVLKALAMAYPAVTFRVRHKGQLLYFWKSNADLTERVQGILEEPNLHFVEGSSHGFGVKAVFSAPNHTFQHRRQMWFFVQNRWVQDSTLQAAVMESYRNLLMHGEYPLVALFVTCDPEDIDVNIHPAKSQVKFRNSSGVFRAVSSVLRAALEKAPWLKGLGGGGAFLKPEPASPPPITERFQAPELERIQYSHKSFEPPSVKETLATYTPMPARHWPSERRAFEVGDATSMAAAAPAPTPASTSRAPAPQAPSGGPIAAARGEWSRLQVLGQAHLTYILAQSDSALVIVDQHAAHERVMFERLMAAWKTQSIEVQSFLIPVTVDLEADRVEALMAVAGDLTRLGLELDQVGPDTLALRSAPALIEEAALIKALHRVAEERLEKGGSFALESVIGDVFATMACHTAIRAGQALSVPEMTSLLQQMDEFPLSSFCPHGRPVYVEYPFSRLERDFGRVV